MTAHGPEIQATEPNAFWTVEEAFLDEAQQCLDQLRLQLHTSLPLDSGTILHLQDQLHRRAEQQQQTRQRFLRAGKPQPLHPEDRNRIRKKWNEVSSALRQQFWYLKMSQDLFRAVLEDRGVRAEGDCRYSSAGRQQPVSTSTLILAEG